MNGYGIDAVERENNASRQNIYGSGTGTPYVQMDGENSMENMENVKNISEDGKNCFKHNEN
jgi:TPP-dependent pyruvate/acetoin dehydrogenase alpha subunit